MYASDADAGSNADISYRIISGGDGMFVIDEETGEVRRSNNGNMDRDVVASPIVLVVRQIT